MIGHVLTALLAAAPLASSVPSFTDAQFGHLALVRGDPERCMDDHVGDLLQHMTLEKKAGQMFHTPLLELPGGEFDHSNPDGPRLGSYTRLGVPITISTEPRRAFTENIGTGFKAESFSGWPEVSGPTATWDPALARKFAEVVRPEYRAAGFRCAPHRILDFATSRGGRDLMTLRERMLPMPAKACGAEHLSEQERVLGILNAGADHFSGEHVTDMLVDLIWNGPVSEERTETSDRRPPAWVPRPSAAPARSLPAKIQYLCAAPGGDRSFTSTVSNKTYMDARNVTVVDTPEEADFALLRVEAPSFPHSGTFRKSFSSGSFEFDEEENTR
ncbi:hypothetical protein DL768_003304 [Monosporascus sp. mg162]|nr:hypothetical protein DL768_003304 [Monosporascus sp. mg162]